MPDFLFHSRREEYRSPVGAVPAGERVHFRITLPRELLCSGAFLEITPDGSSCEVNSMFWCGMNGMDYEFWECHFSPSAPGLYWYRFSLDTPQGRRPLGKFQGGEGRLGCEDSFQLTVYRPDFHPPCWLMGGIIYQIFPDRFAVSGAKKENVPDDRILRDDWGGQPFWTPQDKKRPEYREFINNDYFGGDLRGILSHLDYLSSLGVTCLYLNPIFEAHSNHRYNTADYTRIDPLLGVREDFRLLCRKAEKRGIRVLLDGVFSHTGSDSIYFNKENRYPPNGAYNTQSSPYLSWFHFHQWPGRYESWWGVPTLPEVREESPSFDHFINGEKGIVRSWLADGAAGWRLDVADELPDPFLDHLTAAAKEEKPDALILGEVWEDASNKVSYEHRRRYLLGGQLDTVMNYPFREAILGFLKGKPAEEMGEIIFSLLENYPPQVIHLLMNHIGTHDTPRALTELAGEPAEGRGRQWQSTAFLSPQQRLHGLQLLRLAALLQYTLPGVPSVYYGDEAGMEGYADPFNRSCYPWGGEDNSLLSYYRFLGKVRRQASCLKEGGFHPVKIQGRLFSFLRTDAVDGLLCAVNAGEEPITLPLPPQWEGCRLLLGNQDSLETGSYRLAGYEGILIKWNFNQKGCAEHG